MSRISDLAGFTTALSTTQDLSVGVITATSFSGDGSGLTGVASTDNIQTATDAKFLANVNITGITTATGGFVGALTGSATGLSGTPNITVGSVTAASGSFSGNVTIGGTLTYQDVTNIDSVGIITAQQGIQVLANGVDVTGIGTFEDRITYDGSLEQAGGGTVTYTVTVASKDSTHRYNGQGSGNAYVIDNLQAPVLTLTPGRTYRFNHDNTGSHPLKFYYQADRTTLYTTGVTFDNSYTEIVVTDTTPAVLHYQCTNHALMGNSVFTQSNPIVGAGITLNADGGGVHVTGVVTATSFSGDGSALTGIEAGVANFVASGTIPNGSTVVINSDGTVGIVTLSVSTDPDVGNATVFESASVSSMSAAFDSTNNKVVIAYEDTGNNGYGTAIVGTVSGDNISFGSAVVFSAATSTQHPSVVYDSSNEKIVIAYRNGGNSNYGTAIVGTVSGTSISFGSAVVFESAASYYPTAVFDSNSNKVVIAYNDNGNSNYGTAIVGTVSGTSISFGSPTVFESGSTSNISSTFDSSNNKVVIAYQDGNDSDKGKVVVGTVSGTSISFGSPVVFASGVTTQIAAVFDSSNNKVVIAYRDEGNSNYGTAIVGTVSGTSISFGSAVVFHSANANYITASFDSSNNKVVIAYEDNANNNYGTAVVGTVSGTSISFGSAVVFESAYTLNCKSTFDSNSNKVVITYRDNGNSNYGTAIPFGSTSLVTNLTAENYIGISAEAISDGATGKVNIVGGINTGQTGLTTGRTHYVQEGGGIGLTTSTPSVVAGTSISDTRIIVKG
mgnify:CR=1 FL=1